MLTLMPPSPPLDAGGWLRRWRRQDSASCRWFGILRFGTGSAASWAVARIILGPPRRRIFPPDSL
jgi:hypothetical protein